MEESFGLRKIFGIIILFVLISQTAVLISNATQTSEGYHFQNSLDVSDYPPLPPVERESPIPFYRGDTITFILVLIVIIAVLWTAFTYYRYIKKMKERRNHKIRSKKKIY